MKKFAVFDIDWTLHHSALGTDFLLQLSRDQVIPVDLVEHHKAWQASEPHLRAGYFREHLAPLFGQHLPGTPRTALQESGKRLATAVHGTISPIMMQEITTWRRKGHFLMAISNSPFITVEPLAQLLGFDAWQAPDFEVDKNNNYLRSIPTIDAQRDKGFRLKRLVTTHNLSWHDSAAYGDSIEDLPMLELVSQAIAVDPSSDLAKEAAKRQWRIINKD